MRLGKTLAFLFVILVVLSAVDAGPRPFKRGLKRPNMLAKMTPPKTAGRVLNTKCWDTCSDLHHCAEDDDECWKQCVFLSLPFCSRLAPYSYNRQVVANGTAGISAWRTRSAIDDADCWQTCGCEIKPNCYHDCWHKLKCAENDAQCWNKCECDPGTPMPPRSFWDEMLHMEHDSMEAIDSVQEELQYMPPVNHSTLSAVGLFVGAASLTAAIVVYARRWLARSRLLGQNVFASADDKLSKAQ